MIDRHLWCKRIDCAGRLKRTAVLKVDLVLEFYIFHSTMQTAVRTVP